MLKALVPDSPAQPPIKGHFNLQLGEYELVHILVENNGETTLFPSLQTLDWIPAAD